MSQNPPPDFSGIVVAAGSSTRLGGPRRKQFLELDGRWVVEHAIDRLAAAPAVGEVIVVLSRADVDGEAGSRLRSHPAVSRVVAGGATRADSVAAGLAAVPESFEYVLVHDAARPWASRALIERVAEATRRAGAAVPGIAVSDTVKQLTDSGDVAVTIDRSMLRLAQTPQGARRAVLAAALADRASGAPTDEAGALEAAGHRVVVVEGDAANLKITTGEDLRMSRGGAMDLRVGTGFDIHRVDPDRPLVLGGLKFDGEPGLDGHSDADVVLHAAMDAVLGAAGQGDIGTLFPPGDDRWKGADSWELARTVHGVLTEKGFAIVNLDLMVLAERPKIGPRIEEMRARIAAAFSIGPDRVGVKATTLERLGALGRHEGMACQAVALLARTP